MILDKARSGELQCRHWVGQQVFEIRKKSTDGV
jgi:hypothetical protein